MQDLSSVVNALMGQLPVADVGRILIVGGSLWVTQYGFGVAKNIITQVLESFRKKADANQGTFTAMESKFIDLLEQAISNQVNLQAAMGKISSDGRVDQATMPALLNAIWEDIKANLGFHSWQEFAAGLLGQATAPREQVERALRARMDANVHERLAVAARSVVAEQLDHCKAVAKLAAEHPQLAISKALGQ